MVDTTRVAEGQSSGRRSSLPAYHLLVVRQADLESQDLQQQIRRFEQGLALPLVFGLDQCFQQRVKLTFNPVPETKSMVPGEFPRVLAGPENQIIRFGDHDQFGRFSHSRSTTSKNKFARPPKGGRKKQPFCFSIRSVHPKRKEKGVKK